MSICFSPSPRNCEKPIFLGLCHQRLHLCLVLPTAQLLAHHGPVSLLCLVLHLRISTCLSSVVFVFLCSVSALCSVFLFMCLYFCICIYVFAFCVWSFPLTSCLLGMASAWSYIYVHLTFLSLFRYISVWSCPSPSLACQGLASFALLFYWFHYNLYASACIAPGTG